MTELNPVEASASSSHRSRDGSYLPLPIDVIVVREMFSRSTQSLPREIIDAILDHAEYWAHSSNYADYKSRLRIAGSTRGQDKLLVGYTCGLPYSC